MVPEELEAPLPVVVPYYAHRCGALRIDDGVSPTKVAPIAIHHTAVVELHAILSLGTDIDHYPTSFPSAGARFLHSHMGACWKFGQIPRSADNLVFVTWR